MVCPYAIAAAPVLTLADSAVAGGLDSFITAWSTLGLAVVTTILAGATYYLAREQHAASGLADRHHQESYNAILTVQNMSGVLTRIADGNLYPDPVYASDDEADHEYVVIVGVQNVGGGPATDISFEVQPDRTESELSDEAGLPFTLKQAYPRIIGPQMTATLSCEWRTSEKSINYAGVGASRASVPLPFKVVIRYKNIFGSSGFVIVRSWKREAFPVELSFMPTMERIPAPTTRKNKKANR